MSSHTICWSPMALYDFLFWSISSVIFRIMFFLENWFSFLDSYKSLLSSSPTFLFPSFSPISYLFYFSKYSNSIFLFLTSSSRNEIHVFIIVIYVLLLSNAVWLSAFMCYSASYFCQNSFFSATIFFLFFSFTCNSSFLAYIWIINSLHLSACSYLSSPYNFSSSP